MKEYISNRIESIRSKLKDDIDHSISNLAEKGIENVIIMPLIEHHLGFDPILDVEYEVTHHNSNNRYDFLILKKFVIEAKKHNHIDENSVNQITTYIASDEKINYGIVTDGVTFDFYILKEFILNINTENDFNNDDLDEVYKFLSVSLLDEDFLEIMGLFNKKNFQVTFKAIAKIIHRMYSPVSGKSHKLFKRNNKLDSKVKKMIDDQLDIHIGEYSDAINDEGNEISIGSILTYQSDFIELQIKVTRLGRVSIEILEMNTLKALSLYPKVVELHESKGLLHRKFLSPLDIIKELKGHAKRPNKENHIFNIVS